METVQVTSSADELYCHYNGEYHRQDCYIELDCEKAVLSASYKSGNAVSMDVHHSRALQWTIPLLKTGAVNELLEEIEPLAQIVLEGYSAQWDGRNYCGTYTPDAGEAILEIASLCEQDNPGEFSGEELEELSVQEYMALIDTNGIKAGMTDAELEKWVADNTPDSDAMVIWDGSIEEWAAAQRAKLSEVEAGLHNQPDAPRGRGVMA
jgi:hypothetical protein